MGGGAYYNRCSGMTWSANLFENNSARSGGAGLELNQCAGDVSHCTFYRNKERAFSDLLPLKEHTHSLQCVRYLQLQCGQEPAALHNWSSGSLQMTPGFCISVHECSRKKAAHSKVALTVQGEKGGGVFMDQCNTSVLNCSFSGNHAALLGGGLYRSYPPQSVDIRGCSFLHNSADQSGGAIYEQNVNAGSIEVPP